MANMPSIKLKRKHGVEISNSLASKKNDHTLFVGGEYLRNLTRSEVVKQMKDRNK